MARIALLLLWLSSMSLAAETVAELFRLKLAAEIESIDQRTSGAMGVAIIDLTTGQRWSYRGSVVFPQASSIKIPIMIEVFNAAKEGRLKLADRVTLEPQDAVGGSGHLRLVLRRDPLTLSWEDLVIAMMETSDNTATNKLIAAVGMDRVNAGMERLGFKNTRLQRIMLDSAAAGRNDENISTPDEMASLVELIYRGKAVDEGASKRMVEILKMVQADFRSAVPLPVEVASKPGGIAGVRCETGIIFVPGRPFVLSVMSTYLEGAQNPVKAVAEAAFRTFDRLARSNQYGHRLR